MRVVPSARVTARATIAMSERRLGKWEHADRPHVSPRGDQKLFFNPT